MLTHHRVEVELATPRQHHEYIARSMHHHVQKLIVDEFIVNNKWEEDEFKALNEFCDANGFKYEVVAVSLFTKQVVCRLK